MERESLGDVALAVFIGTFLAHLLIWVLTGRADEIRRGIRSLTS